jgi:hypothetical protein
MRYDDDSFTALDARTGRRVTLRMMQKAHTPSDWLRLFPNPSTRKELDDRETSEITGATYPRGRLFLDVLADLVDGDEDDARDDDDDEVNDDADRGDDIAKAGDRHGHHSLSAALVDHLHDALAAARERHGYQKSAKETPMASTSHSELVRSVVKQYGIVALAKSMVQDQKSYGLDESRFVNLATEHAQHLYPNDRPDSAFSKLYESEESVRRACQVAKAMPSIPYMDLKPQVVGGTDVNPDDPSAALDALHRIGRERWPEASEAVRFTRAFEAHPELTAKAHRRPTPPPGGAYAWPR